MSSDKEPILWWDQQEGSESRVKQQWKGEPGRVSFVNINVCFDQGGGAPALSFSVTSLMTVMCAWWPYLLQGGGWRVARWNLQHDSEWLDEMRRSWKKLSMVELRGGGGVGGGVQAPEGVGFKNISVKIDHQWPISLCVYFGKTFTFTNVKL